MLKPAIVLVALLLAAPTQAQHAPAASAIRVRPAVAPALDDPTIVAIFDAANTWDIETSELAMKKSHNADVRRFAVMMVRDHKAVRQMGRDLAKRLAVTPTPPGKDFALAVDHAATMKTLRKAKGTAFDKAYVDHEAWYHQAVIDAVTTQLLPATTNADLKALEVKVAPNFQAHLAMAKEIQGKLAR